ncbi:hypothetical protein [Pseudomonas sp. LB3P58]
MNFNQSNIEELVERTLTIECFDIRITQNSDNSPFSFKGPGSIALQADGTLLLNMYDADKKTDMAGMMRLFFERNAGIVQENEYCSLSAIDEKGSTWIYPRLYVNDGLRAGPHGTIINLKIPNLRTSKIPRKPFDLAQAEIIILGRFTLPFNKYEVSNGYSTLTLLEFSTDEFEFRASQKAKHLKIDVTARSSDIDQNFIAKLTEGLGIAIGRDTSPAYYCIGSGNNHESFLNGNADIKGLGVMEPLVQVFYGKTEGFVEFINLYVKNRTVAHDPLINYWRRLYYVSDIITDVSALVLTVNIEGMIKNYFSQNRTPSAEVLGYIKLSQKTIRKTKLPSATKDRIQQGLGNMKKLSTTSILRELVSEGVIADAQVLSWTTLRNSLAHADNGPDSTERFEMFIENIYNCLSLFYRLIGLSIGYDFIQSAQLNSEVAPALEVDSE